MGGGTTGVLVQTAEPVAVATGSAHKNPKHDVDAPGTHIPVPSQLRGTTLPLSTEQIWPQEVLVRFWQEPLPSHIPLVPQIETLSLTHMLAGSAPPALTLLQVPRTDPAQVLQLPVQAEAQHTPWAHTPGLPHSDAITHVSPTAFLASHFLPEQ